MMSCGNNSKTSGDDNDSTTVVLTDTMALSSSNMSFDNKYATVTASISYPGVVKSDEKPDVVTSRIRRAIADMTYDFLANMASLDGDKPKMKVFEGSIDVMDEMLDNYTKETYSALSKISKEEYEEAVKCGFADDTPQQFSAEFSLSRTYETDKYIVFRKNTAGFTGGAHGYYDIINYTFDKSDGYMFNDFVKSGKELEMQDILKEGVKQYFKEQDQVITSDEQLWQYLLIDGTTIPMPQSPLSPDDKGIVFIYQTYEIAAYAAGAVNFTIPYKKIKPFLTDKAKTLLGIE